MFESSAKKQISSNAMSKSTLPQPDLFRGSILSNFEPDKRSASREHVMSKIITSKEETIIHLKEQIDKQEREYEEVIR